MPFCVLEVGLAHQNGHISQLSVLSVMSCSVPCETWSAVDVDIFFLQDNLFFDLFDIGTVLCLVALFSVFVVLMHSVTPED